MRYLAPSILSADFYNLQKDLDLIKKNKVDYLHIDVMDGHFVPNISMGIPIVESLNRHVASNFIFDTHLMIKEPEKYIESFAKAGADILTIHVETAKNCSHTIQLIKDMGIKAGISLNPETNIEKLDEVLNLADLVLVMSVHPGFGGQKFIESSLDKAKYLCKMRHDKGYKYLIEMDGGINIDNLKIVLDAGVDIVVAGSSIFKGDIDKNLISFNSIIREYNE